MIINKTFIWNSNLKCIFLTSFCYKDSINFKTHKKGISENGDSNFNLPYIHMTNGINARNIGGMAGQRAVTVKQSVHYVTIKPEEIHKINYIMTVFLLPRSPHWWHVLKQRRPGKSVGANFRPSLLKLDCRVYYYLSSIKIWLTKSIQAFLK